MMRKPARPSAHPSPTALERFASGDCAAVESARIDAHLSSCDACRPWVRDTRAMTVLLNEEPTPPLPANALARIHARRAAGERGPLVEAYLSRGAQGRTRRRVWPTAIGIALAASVVAAVTLSDGRQTGQRAAMQPTNECLDNTNSTGADPMASPTFRRLLALAYALPLTAVGGCTVDQSSTPMAPAPPLAAGVVDGARLVPATLSYRATTLLDGTSTTPLNTQLSIARSTRAGAATWVVASSGDDIIPDTLVLDAVSLVPRQAFSRRNANERGFSYSVDLDSRNLEFRIRNSRGALSTDRAYVLPTSEASPAPVLLPVAMRALPLAMGWSASFEVFQPWRFFVGPFLRHNDAWYVRVTANLQVVGDDRVTVPAGIYDCWRVRVEHRWTGAVERAADDAEVMWVSKRDGWIVKTASVRGDGDDRQEQQTVLVSVQ